MSIFGIMGAKREVVLDEIIRSLEFIIENDIEDELKLGCPEFKTNFSKMNEYAVKHSELREIIKLIKTEKDFDVLDKKVKKIDGRANPHVVRIYGIGNGKAAINIQAALFNGWVEDLENVSSAVLDKETATYEKIEAYYNRHMQKYISRWEKAISPKYLKLKKHTSEYYLQLNLEYYG